MWVGRHGRASEHAIRSVKTRADFLLVKDADRDGFGEVRGEEGRDAGYLVAGPAEHARPNVRTRSVPSNNVCPPCAFLCELTVIGPLQHTRLILGCYDVEKRARTAVGVSGPQLQYFTLPPNFPLHPSAEPPT